MFVVNIVAKIINFILTIFELVLFTRFFLLFFAVTADFSVAGLIYKITDPLVAPFSNIFQQLYYGNLVIDSTTLFAVIAYGFVEIILVTFISRPTVYN